MDDPLFHPPVTVQRRFLAWDAQGNPALTTAPLVTKAVMQDLYNAAAAMPYSVADPLDPDYQYNGMSCAEVMVRKRMISAARLGDPEAVADRLMGKPKQTSESLRVNASYEDFLKDVARKVAARPAATDAEVVE